MSSFCVIRRYQNDDKQWVKDIITEATMEQVNNFFWGALFSEMLPQVSVAFVALCYIVVGVPLKYCLMAIPLVVILLYVCVWLGHYIKATELTTDLDNIPSNYLNDNGTNFYVAEMYGKAGEAELASLINKVKKVEYDFYTEKEFEVKDLNKHGMSRVIVGSVGITRSLNHSERAWIRRMAVKKEYRRRGIASHLLTEAITFCEKQKYNGIELITTECHSEAKQLYGNQGFTDMEVSHRSYLGLGTSQMCFHMFRPINRPSKTDSFQTDGGFE